MSSDRVKLSVYLGGAVIFMMFALYNGFAIITYDSAAYLASGLNIKIPDDRPVFYGLFIRFTSLMFSSWITLFIQCLLLSYLSIRFVKSIAGNVKARHLIGLLFIISLGTIAGWYAGQLMPDIFTSILFLSSYLYLKESNSRWERFFLLFIIYISVTVHLSHQVIGGLFAVALFILSQLVKSYFRTVRFRSLHVLMIVIAGWSSISISNYLSGNRLVTSKAAHVFLMGKLNESGVLGTYLKKACPVYHYNICEYQHDMPIVAWEFVWDHERSPVYKTGGWEANREEYNTIIKDIISRPKYWPFLFFKSMEATFRQILLLNIDEAEERSWARFEKGDFVYASVERMFPHEVNEFIFSKQNTKNLDVVFYDHVYAIVFLLSTFIILLLDADTRKKAIPVYIFVVLFLFLNAFVTATFANVHSRLNSRAVWLLPMTNIVFIYKYLKDRTSKRLENTNINT